MPLLAILVSAAGLVPFVVCGLGALGADPSWHMLDALVGYGAVTLAFAGGVHWGFALGARQEGEPGVERARLALPVVPALLGWIALLALLVAWWLALGLLIAAYIGTALLEQQAARRGLTPPRYMLLRWVFTGVALAMLITVLTLRLLGQTITVF